MEVIEGFVSNEGLRFVAELAPPGDDRSTGAVIAAYVEGLGAIHGRYSVLVGAAFDGEPAFKMAVDKAFRRIVNAKLPAPVSEAPSSELLGQPSLDSDRPSSLSRVGPTPSGAGPARGMLYV